MKISLWDVLRGKDIDLPQKEKTITETGGFLDFGFKKLSGEKEISDKLIQSFEEWVFINVTTLAEAVSLLEFELFKFQMVEGQIELVPVEEHELLDLLDKFNENTTRQDAIYNTESHLDLAGESFWYLEGGKNKGRPSTISLLIPDKVKLNPDTSPNSRSIVRDYEYSRIIDGKEVKDTFVPDEVLHIKIPNPSNPYRGKSTVEAISTTIDTDNFAQLALNNLFRNGMIGDFMLSTDKRMTPDQLKRFRAQFRAAYTGVKNAWNIPILFGGVKPEKLQMTGREMQLIELEEWLRNKIMSAFKNTRASLGIDDEVNRSTSESSILNWKRSVIAPKMARIVNNINEFLVPRYGDNLLLGFKDPVPEDRDSEIKRAVDLFKEGIITKNEARQIVDYEEVEGGEEFKSNPVAPTFDPDLQKRFPSLKYVNYKSVFRKAQVYSEAKEYQDTFNKALPIARQIVKGKKSREHGKFNNEQVWDYWEKQISLVVGVEEVFEQRVDQFVDSIVEEGLTNIDARSESELVDKDRKMEEAYAKFAPLLTEVMISSGQLANRLIGNDDPYVPTKAVDTREELRKQILLFAESMIDTDVDIMVDLLAEGLKEGLSVAQIRRNIQDKFDQFSKVQAERITRTEVLKSSNLGSQDSFEQSGVVVGKQWLTAMDDRTDPLCASLNGKIIDLKQDFFKRGDTIEAGGKTMKLDYSNTPYPPLHTSCRCTLLPVIKGQEDFDVRSFGAFEDLKARIKELEGKVDKRTKAYRDLKQKNMELEEYSKELEVLVNE